ncbi:MAG: hypothetical protein ACRYHA_10690 [Janthinobacterium lividum]
MMHPHRLFRASLLVLGCGVTLTLAAQETTGATPAQPPSTRHTTHTTHTTHASLPKKAASGASAHEQTVWQSPQASAATGFAAPDKTGASLTGMGAGNTAPDAGSGVSGSASDLKKPY